MPSELESRAPGGAVLRKARALLADDGLSCNGVEVVDRSPVGAGSVRIRPQGPAEQWRETLTCWFGSQDWVETLAVRPPHIYVRPTTDAIRSWVTEGWTASLDALVCGPRLDIADIAPDASSSLDSARRTAVARALTALSRWCGDPEQEAASVFIGAAGTPVPPSGNLLTIGAVDVAHGPLRARYGGVVNTDDLLAEIECRTQARTGRVAGADHAAAALSFLLLRTPCRRRARMDDARIEAETAVYGVLLSARLCSRQNGLSGQDRTAVRKQNSEDSGRSLAITADQLPTVLQRSFSELEPALLARYGCDLSRRITAAAPHLPPEDPLWQSAHRASAIVLDGLAGSLQITTSKNPEESMKCR